MHGMVYCVGVYSPVPGILLLLQLRHNILQTFPIYRNLHNKAHAACFSLIRHIDNEKGVRPSAQVHVACDILATQN